MYKKILLPTDGSPLCKEAVQAGIALAAAVGAKVVGFYAAPPATPVVYRNLLPVGYGSPAQHAEMIAKAAERNLGFIENAAKKAGVEYEGVTVTNDFAADAILAMVKKKKCDLIVMASHSRKGVQAWLMGSQTQKVLAQSPVPVLVHR